MPSKFDEPMATRCAHDGDFRTGSLWICEEERNVGDWYMVSADQQDKTVHISFAPNTDGKLELATMSGDLGAYAESTELQKNAQCINIRGGVAEQVFINVTAETIYDRQNDQRVDYTLQIVETDLDANPRGECDVLNQGLYDFHPWPTLQ